MKLTNIGVQLMPIFLIISSVLYFFWQAYVLCTITFVLAVLMWLMLLGETKDLKL